jgi:hypothetical protein
MHTNNELSATSILSLFETTKAERTSFVRSVINSLKDGNADPLKVHLQVKNTEALIKELSDDKEYKEMLLTQAAKHGKNFDLHNANFRIQEVGTKYDFAHCGDSVINDLYTEMEHLKAEIKKREEFLKSLPANGLDIVDSATGEVSTLLKPIKTSTTSIAVTLK